MNESSSVPSLAVLLFWRIRWSMAKLIDGSRLRRVLRILTDLFHVIAKPIIVHKAFGDLLAEKYLRLILLHEIKNGRLSVSLLVVKVDKNWEYKGR